MATFRDREKCRQTALKGNIALFSSEAQAIGSYGGKPYEFCLGVYAEEVIRLLTESCRQPEWADYIRLWYGAMA